MTNIVDFPGGDAQKLPGHWRESYRELRAAWRHSPILYAKQRLGLNPTWQQADLLNAIREPGAKVTARSGHGTGKSAGMAVAIWWKLECFDFSKVPCTAPSAVQLRDILWAEIAKWYRHSFEVSHKFGFPQELYLSNMFEITQDKIACRGAPKEWFAVARTARPEQPDALQGFHASDITVTEDGREVIAEEIDADGYQKGQIMFVIEEAGGVHDKIFEVAEGALSSPNASLLMGGNPTRGTGYFAKSHKANRGDYIALQFKSMDSPLVSAGYREGLIRKFGEGSNVVRVRADGEFPRADDDTLIPLEDAEAAILRPKQPSSGDRKLGIDVARYGDDRTVFVLRDGSNVEQIRIEAKIDTMTCAGLAAYFIRTWKADSVHIDISGGLGAGPYDRLVELRKQGKISQDVILIGVNVATKAPDRSALDTDHQPYRLRDYIWLEMKSWVSNENPSFAGCARDNAEDLAGELASVRYFIDSSGRLVVESKDQMKKRHIRSCDIADALGTTFFSSGVIGPGAAIYELVRRQAEEERRRRAAEADPDLIDGSGDDDDNDYADIVQT